jgi:hypothetical protein
MNHFIRVSLYEVFRVVVISSFGKLSALAAMVWTGDFYLWLPAVLVLPAHFQAYRGEIMPSLIFLSIPDNFWWAQLSVTK